MFGYEDDSISSVPAEDKEVGVIIEEETTGVIPDLFKTKPSSLLSLEALKSSTLADPVFKEAMGQVMVA